MNPEQIRERINQLLTRAEEIERIAQDGGLNDQLREEFDAAMAEIQQLRGDLQRAENLASVRDSLGPGARALPNLGADGAGDDPATIGLNPRELARYSIVRAIRAAATGRWDDAGLEREASEAVSRALGRDPEGFFVPTDVLRTSLSQARAGVALDTTTGGAIVEENLLTTSFIELLRNRMMTRALGAQVLGGLVGKLDLPRQTGGATLYWVTEGSDVSLSTPSIDQVQLAPQTCGAATELTRQLLKQTSLDVEAWVRAELAKIIALGLDYVALHGDNASGEPIGIANATGVGVVPIGTDGGYPNWGHIVDLETEVAVDNADVGRMAYLTNAKVRGRLKKTAKESGTAIFIWAGKEMNGYRAEASNQVRSDLTKGSGTGLSAIFFGNWSDLVIGSWGGIDIIVNPYAKDTSGGVRVTALAEADVAVRHPQSFAVILDAQTA